MEGRLLGPAMIAQGFPTVVTAAILAFGSISAAAIPPSIGLILFGFINEVSIGRLFLAEVIPGALLTVALMFATWPITKRHGYATAVEAPPTRGTLRASFCESVWALAFPVILIVRFRLGIFTATAAGAFLVLYALFIGKFIQRDLTLAKLREAMKVSLHDIGMIMLLIMMAGVLGYAITIERAPQEIACLIPWSPAILR